MKERFTTRQAIFAICRNDKGEILLEQRANTGYLDGFWDFPSGHVEKGEGLRESMARELHEETNLTVQPENMKLVHIDQYFGSESGDADYVNYTFLITNFSGEPKILEPVKCSGLGWFSVDKLPEKLTINVRQNQFANFSEDLTYSITDKSNYENILKGEIDGKE